MKNKSIISRILLTFIFLSVLSAKVSTAEVNATDLTSIQAAADKGNVEAQNRLGIYYQQGEGGQPDYAKAMKWYQKAAAQGDAFAQFGVGILFYSGKGVPQDYKAAAEWFRKAAEQGNPYAQRSLSYLYKHGLGVVKDQKKAEEWAQKTQHRVVTGTDRTSILLPELQGFTEVSTTPNALQLIAQRISIPSSQKLLAAYLENPEAYNILGNKNFTLKNYILVEANTEFPSISAADFQQLKFAMPERIQSNKIFYEDDKSIGIELPLKAYGNFSAVFYHLKNKMLAIYIYSFDNSMVTQDIARTLITDFSTLNPEESTLMRVVDKGIQGGIGGGAMGILLFGLLAIIGLISKKKQSL